MIPTIKLENTRLNICYEISQKDNYNSCARLFITEDRKHVIKLFDGIEHKTAEGTRFEFIGSAGKNLDTIQQITKLHNYIDKSVFALPEALIEYRGTIVGYVMPYVNGLDLFQAIDNYCLTPYQKSQVFNALAEAIIGLPKGIYIGDLHSHNIIIDSALKVTIIDLDGFSLQKKWLQSCPLQNIQGLPSKYYSRDGGILVSKDTDILCLFRLYFLCSFCGHDLLRFPIEQISKTLPAYYSSIGANNRFVDAVSKLFTESPNIVYSDMFSAIPGAFLIDNYINWHEMSNIKVEEEKAMNYLNYLIEANQSDMTRGE